MKRFDIEPHEVDEALANGIVVYVEFLTPDGAVRHLRVRRSDSVRGLASEDAKFYVIK